MADMRFSDWSLSLPARGAMATTDVLPVVLGSADTRQTTAGAFVTLASGVIVPAAVAATLASPALAPTVVADAAFAPAVRTVTAAQLVAGANVTITPVGATLTIAASGGGGTSTPPIMQTATAGRWYVGTFTGGAAAGSALLANNLTFMPLMVTRQCTISDLGSRVTTAVAGNVQFAIYASDTDGKPTGLPLATTASITTVSSANISAALSVNVQLNPNTLYWFAACVDTATAALQTIGTSNPLLHYVYGAASQGALVNGNTIVNGGFVFAGTFGTWPDFTALSLSTTSQGRNWLAQYKVTSVP